MSEQGRSGATGPVASASGSGAAERISPGAGPAARLVESFDWAATPLGPFAGWPDELKSVVRQILESGFPAAVVWGPGLTTIYNDAFRPILGRKPEAMGRSFADIWAEAWHAIAPIAERALAGEATYIENFPLVIERDRQPEQAWFTFCYSPLRLSDGTVAGFLDTVVETTETVRARSDLATANQELGHRLKNTLALIQSIASQSLKGVQPEAKVAAFRERVVALGRAQDVLLGQKWSAVSMRELAVQTLQPLDGLSQVTIKGEDVELGSRAAVTLALILHELATNAMKYGALSVPDGCVDLSWGTAGAVIRIEWRERGGPPVEQPAHRGFGSRLIERGFGGRSKVSRRFADAGLVIEIEAPVDELAA